MELRHLRYFAAAADLGSFSAAGRSLHVSQSAISEQVSDLEDEIGGPLFLRSHRVLILTSQGKLFLAEARKILEASSQALRLVRSSLTGEVGTLSIGFFVWGIGSFFPKLIREYHKRNPGVQVELHDGYTHEQLQLLAEKTIDVGFSRPIGPPYDRVFCSEPLYREPIVALLPSDHALAGRPVHISELIDESFIMCDHPGNLRNDTTVEICLEAGFRPNIVNTSHTWNGVIALVEAGVGISLAPAGIQRSLTPDVVLQPLQPHVSGAGVSLTWNPENDSPLLQNFIQLVRENKERIASTGWR